MSFIIEPISDVRPHLPRPILDGIVTTIDLETIIDAGNHQTIRYADMFKPDQRRLGGYFLPPFQRPPVWDEARKVALVESLLLGVSIGTIVVVDAKNLPMNGELFADTDMWLLDGQQRVGALLDYSNDLFPVFVGTACEHRWSDLNQIERRFAWRQQIGIIKIQTDDEAKCRAIYDRMNFGGIAHTEDQRAIKV